MAGLIALVGGNEFRRDCEPMDRALLARLGSTPKVVIVPTAAAHENPRLAADNGVRYFRRLGAQSEAAMIVDAQGARQTSLVAQINNADLVYFTGGDPVYLLETMRDSPTWRAASDVLDRRGAIAGSSAGAMICGGQMWAPGHGWREGLGLVPPLKENRHAPGETARRLSRRRAIMRIPYVIDNQVHKLADVLNAILAQRAGSSLDIATTLHYPGCRRRDTIATQSSEVCS